MPMKERLAARLKQGREFTESLLSAFETPQQWTHQVHDRANHALWFAGHMGTADNFFISLVAPERADDRPEYTEKFGTGSQPTSNPEDYPPVEDVLQYMRDRRRVLLEVLDGLGDEDLNRATPEGSPSFMPDYASVFETAIWHEGIHSGQVTVAHRALGNPPLFARPTEDAET